MPDRLQDKEDGEEEDYMAHECPECYHICYCDMDDLLLGGEPPADCRHLAECPYDASDDEREG